MTYFIHISLYLLIPSLYIIHPSSLSPPVTTSYFSVSASLFLSLYSRSCCIFRFHILSDIIQYLSFSVWLTSVSVIPSKSIHVANGKISLFEWLAVFHSIYILCLLYPFICWWKLRFLPYLGNYQKIYFKE